MPANQGQIRYIHGMKYVTRAAVTLTIPIHPPGTIRIPRPGGRANGDDLVTLTPAGLLTIGTGYAWDGASGPAIDTRNFMGASLVHDVLYQLIRTRLKEFIPANWGFSEDDFARLLRKQADKIMRALCIGAGMCRLRAWWVYWGVREGGWCAARPEAEPEVLNAPLVLVEVK